MPTTPTANNNINLCGLKVFIDHKMIDEYRSCGDLTEWHEEFNNHIQSVSLTEATPDVLSNLQLNIGDKIYLVWAEWSHGDSLGRSYCGSVEALAVFKDINSADWFAEQCRECPKSSDMLLITTPDGQSFNFQPSWCEWFDVLEGIHIETVVVL